MRCNAEFYYVGKIPRTGIGRPSLQRRVVLKWFLFTASRGNNFVGGKSAPPSALLVIIIILTDNVDDAEHESRERGDCGVTALQVA